MNRIESLERRLLFAAGDLDAAFGNAGLANTDFGGGIDRARDLVVQANGMIVAVGDASATGGTDLGLARFTDAGALDPTFGTGGKVTLDLGSATDQGQRIALQNNGEILVGGNDGTQAIVARYTASGALDTTFSDDGKLELSQLNSVAGIAQMTGGAIVVAGTTPGGEFAVIRLSSAGAFDATFGSAGIGQSTFGGSALAHDMVVSEGRFLVVGEQLGNVAVARFTVNGTPDSNFGTGGEVLTPNGRGRGVAVQPNGLVVVAGQAGSESAVYRYTAAGILDTTWDGDGIATFDAGGVDTANALVIDSSGRVVVAGTSNVGLSGARAYMARIDSSGALETAFGTSGIATTGGTSVEDALAAAIGGDNRYLMGGLAVGDMAVWRFDNAGGGSGGGDQDVPTAVLAALDVDPNGDAFYTFDVIYSDNSALLTSSIDDNDIRVRGPGNYNVAASLLNVSEPTNGTPRIATYVITPPGGSWDPLDAGTYTVLVNGLQVRDVAGNYVAPGAIGTFNVGQGGSGEVVLGTDQADRITVVRTAGGNLIITVNGNQRVAPASPTVTVFGFGGDDRIYVEGAINAILSGGDGNDTLWGGAGNDELDGSEGSDRLVGRGGDDTYVFQSAIAFQKDTIVEVGNGGVDTLDFSQVFERIHVDLSKPIDPLSHYKRHVHPGRRGMFANFENVIGGPGSDVIRGNDANNTLTGGGGDDIIQGMAGNNQLIGGPGDDRYVFADSTGNFKDFITEAPNEGADTVDMRNVNTSVLIDLGGRELAWQQGRSIRIGAHVENAWGGAGNDLLIGSIRASSVLNGGQGDDSLFGGPFNDFLYGEAGDDLLRGNEGDDLLVGGPGNDRYDGGAGNNVLLA